MHEPWQRHDEAQPTGNDCIDSPAGEAAADNGTTRKGMGDEQRRDEEDGVIAGEEHNTEQQAEHNPLAACSPCSDARSSEK